jgi:hypothetical protein
MLYYWNLLDSHRIRLVILLGVLLLAVVHRKKQAISIHPGIAPLLLFLLLYPALYFPLFIIDRYIFICILLFNFFFFYAAALAWELYPKKPLIIAMAAGLIIIITPLLMMGKRKLAISATEFRYYKAFDQQLPNLAFLQNQPIASDGSASLESVQLCYHYHCRYYCTWADRQLHSLQQYKIRFLLTIKEQASLPFLVLKEKIPVDNNTLYIYEIK